MVYIATIKEKMNKIIISQYFPFVFWGLLVALIHYDINLQWGDDVYFSDVLGDNGTFEVWRQYLGQRYHNWTSRLIIEGVLVIVVHYPLLWKIIDTVLMIWIAKAISIFFNDTKNVKMNWWIILIMLAFPFEIMNSAGWIATTLNYLWPLAFGFIGMIPVNNLIKKKKNSMLTIFFSVIALCYAINQEQMCAVIWAIYFLCGVYMYLKEKKLPWIIVLGLLLSTISLLFIISCPGNMIRTEQEIATWFSSFRELSFFNKLEMGYSSSLFEFFMKPNLVFFLFSLLLIVLTYYYNKKIIYRIIASLPFIVSIVIGLFGNIFSLVFPNIIALTTSMTETGTNIKLTEMRMWIPDTFITLILVCIIISIWQVVTNKKMAIVLIYIGAIGFVSRIIMGFSPTIWASGTRTFIFMYFSIMIISVILFKEILKIKCSQERMFKIMPLGIGIASIFIIDHILYYINSF
ncbi:DUF6056 family protein [Eubacterium sp. An3]|uniref:DUF6056 family protein n=1 Tax=Eubacterium sp. An3 TaxID=1965628 RepID=UPI000B3948B0|nr:DUF6056 family protein [Eubacterium sp. An3]OUO28999.1 hypothetical protein B5F87_04340 [Eubacterium sp. An3]